MSLGRVAVGGGASREGDFPPCPVKGSALLVPIRSWAEIHAERLVTGVEFDEFWYDQVQSRVAYFFRWMGSPRQTVLAIWDGNALTHVECRMQGDEVGSALQIEQAVLATKRAFRLAGYSA